MNIFFKNFNIQQQWLSVVLPLLICLSIQNSCTALNLNPSSTIKPHGVEKTVEKTEAHPTYTPLFTNTPLATKKPPTRPAPKKTSTNQTVSPLFSSIDSKLFSPLVMETPITDEEKLRQAVEELTSRLEENITSFSAIEPNKNIKAASEPHPKTKTSIFLSIIMGEPDTQIMSATLFNNFLPLILEQSHVAHSTPAVAAAPVVVLPAPLAPVPPTLVPPTPVPQPLPTPDSVMRTVKVPILMYHYLSRPPAGADIYRQDLSVAPDLFARHLDSMLEAGYQTINLYDLTMHLTIGAPLPAKSVIITFDDGYRDNYNNAFPLLVERGMKATFFVSPEFIERQRPEYADWPMLRSMHNAGMSIEAHGLNHLSLKRRGIEFLAWQALASIQAIEREIGQRPRFISYPAGEYDQLTIEVFHNSHFWAGLTTVQGTTQHANAMFEMQRIRVRNTSQPEDLIELMSLDW